MYFHDRNIPLTGEVFLYFITLEQNFKIKNRHSNTSFVPPCPQKRVTLLHPLFVLFFKGKTAALIIISKPSFSNYNRLNNGFYSVYLSSFSLATFNNSKEFSLIACSMRQASCSATSGSIQESISLLVKNWYRS